MLSKTRIIADNDTRWGLAVDILFYAVVLREWGLRGASRWIDESQCVGDAEGFERDSC